MQVILLEDVKKLGEKGDIVRVSDGYARNMLIPQKKAVEANDKNKKGLRIQKEREVRAEAVNLANAQVMAEKLTGATVTIPIKAGEKGRVFGSISTREIADAIKKQTGLELDRKKIQMNGVIKTLGFAEVTVRLYKGVSVPVSVNVIKAEP